MQRIKFAKMLPIAACLLIGSVQSALASPDVEAAVESITEDSDARPIAVCPDGNYGSVCSQSDVDKAITLADDYLLTLRSRCLYQTEARCDVLASGTISSMERGGPVIWQQVNLQPNDGPQTQMMVVAETRLNTPQLVFAGQVEGYYSPPDMVENSDEGVLIHVPGIMGGTGGGNGDALLLRKKEGWTKINLDGWFDQVGDMLPKGFEIRKGVSFNFREMFAGSPVWRENDGNCCATGGWAGLDLEIRGGRLYVSRISFDETKPVGRTQYIEAKAGVTGEAVQ